MKHRFSTTALGGDDKKRLAGVMSGDAVEVDAAGAPGSIRREFDRRAYQDLTQKVLFPAASAITGTVATIMGMMLWMSGSGVWVAPIAVFANVLIETVGHGIAQTKFSALNTCNAKLSDYYNALLEEGYVQACCNMVKKADGKLMRGESLEVEELAVLMTITPDQPAWSDAGIGLQVTILQARQVVACMRGDPISPVTFEGLGMNPHHPVDREIVLEHLLEAQVALAEDNLRLPYMIAPAETFENDMDNKIRVFEMVKTVLWGSLRGMHSAYFARPPAPMELPEKVAVHRPAVVGDLARDLVDYEALTGQLPEFPSLRW